MKAFWASRAPRERAVLLALGAAATVLLVFALVWLPFERSRARLTAEVPRLAASVATMQRQSAEVVRLRSLPPSTAALSTPIAAVAPALGKALPGAQVAGVDEKRVRITGADLAYGTLLETLAIAQASYGMRVDTARVDALPAAGRVRAEVMLSR